MLDDLELSPAGQERRERILRLAQREARLRRARRGGRRLALGAAVLVIAATLAFFRPYRPASQIAVTPHDLAPPRSPNVLSHSFVASPRLITVVITRVATEPNISTRLATQTEKPRWQVLNDDQLIDQLDKAGCPAGLAWINGHESLLFRRAPDASKPSTPDGQEQGS